MQAFTDSFRDCKVDCKLILPYLDAVGEMLLPVGSSSDIMLNVPFTCLSISYPVCKCMAS